MAKKSKRRVVHHERGQSGCMSGLIGIFDFRQGRSTRRLLSDKKHGSSRHSAGTESTKSRVRLLGSTHGRSDADIDNFSDSGELERLKVGISKTSVKKLIEEDMCSEQQTDEQNPNATMEQMRPDPDSKRSTGKNHKQAKNTCKVASGIHVRDSRSSATLETQEYNQPNSAKILTHMDLTSLMEEFCSKIQHSQELHLHQESRPDCCNVHECKDFVARTLQQKLSEAAEAFLSQKLIEAKQLTEDGTVHQSRQFLDALEILNSNKELLLKLLEDSNSLQVKHTQDLQVTPEKVHCVKLLEGISIGRPVEERNHQKELQKHNSHNFFWKRDKSPKKDSSKESENFQGSNHIVVLRPKPAQISVPTVSPSSSPQPKYNLRSQGWSGKVQSHFSFSEIKRKLKNTIGEDRKERHWVSIDGTRHKVPNENQDQGNSEKLNSKNNVGEELHIKRENKPSHNGEKEEKVQEPAPYYPSTSEEVVSARAARRKNLTITTAGYPKQRESNIYIEAKKHLEDILTGGAEDGGLLHQKSPKTLGRILALPDYSSTTVYSPGRDGEHGFITAQMRFSPNGNFRIVNENIWRFKPDKNTNTSQPSPSKKNLEIQQDTADIDNSCIKTRESDSNSDSSKPDKNMNTSQPSPSMKNLEIQQDTADIDDSCTKTQESDSNPDSSEELTECQENIPPSNDSSPKGDFMIMEEIDVASAVEDILTDEPSKSNAIPPIISTDATEIMEEEEEESTCLTMESLQDNQPPSTSICSSSSSPLLLQKVEPLENINEFPERPSPISVLEPFFDDANSSTATTPQAELQNQRLHFDIEEDDCSTVFVTTSDLNNHPRPCMEDKIPPFEYVTAVLQATKLNWDELLEKHNSSEQLLNPSLFDEVEAMPSQHIGDKELLFDCINEVLGELYERYFGSSPWVAFISPDIRPAPMGKNIIHEVWDGINWNLLPQSTPRTLDDIIGKDMEKARAWIDLRSDAEVIGNEMVDDILDDLLDETVFDLRSD